MLFINKTIQVWLVLLVILPTMAFFLTGFPGIRLKFLNMRNITQANTDDDIDRRVLTISKLSDGALSYFANITGHSSNMIIAFLFRLI